MFGLCLERLIGRSVAGSCHSDGRCRDAVTWLLSPATRREITRLICNVIVQSYVFHIVEGLAALIAPREEMSCTCI